MLGEARGGDAARAKGERARMDTRSLTAFKLVYELGSIAQAAHALYISPQGLSKTISHLEGEFGCRLFMRSARGVAPTEAARALYPRVAELTDLLGDIRRAMAATGEMTIRVAVSSGYFMRFGSDFFQGYAAAHPEHPLEAIEYLDEDVLSRVRSGDADCGFTPAPADRNEFDSFGMVRHPYLLLVNESHPLARADVLDYGDLEGCNLVALGNGHIPYRSIKAHIDSAGVRPASFAPIVEITTGIDLARRGEACCFITDFAASSFAPRGLVAKPFRDPDLTWDYAFVKRKGKASSALTALRDFTSAWLAAHRDVVFR